jgi:hypothetical protein
LCHRENLLEARTERHHLKPAAVGECRSGPIHEAAKAAGGLDDVCTRLQVKVVGIRE